MSRKAVRATPVLLLASINSIPAFILATQPQARPAVIPIILVIAMFVLSIAAVLRIYTAAVVLGRLLGVIGSHVHSYLQSGRSADVAYGPAQFQTNQPAKRKGRSES